MKLEIIADRLDTLGNATRLSIFRTLVRAGQAGLPVGQLQSRLGVPGSTLSHHLRRLVEVGLVTQQRQSTTLICRADFTVMNATLDFLKEECCRDLATADVAAPSRPQAQNVA